ncbi:Os11g0210000 [Oryza sativa Japonica Group]|uniref:Expressed protein n=2 Tax=Oryza sativa subsp. japonica TaxID=39947 RepID=Q0ITX1_ORYSJ|nr:expressed protein [Oryza sativa Japonica Group]KAF2910051.1 hypothetical protein DAI22_11g070800 [Oryza sativa Japonica Group]BAF27844.1 Os11g0210000 [Oryza sativa Japonica Group]BAT13170.1 Os11g0210000 [Oryza sativa Japonica Group]|eukprot:NP_001067481.1 Os11g0210000 [Oryza sativa Japonica Group]
MVLLSHFSYSCARIFFFPYTILISSPNASPRQLERKIGQLQDLKNSAQEVSSDDTLQMFHESILQSSHSLEEPHATLKRATDSSRLQFLSEDVAMLCCMNAQI